MKRRPVFAATVCALTAQIAALYLENWFKVIVILTIFVELILFVKFLTGKAWKSMLYPVIFLSFLLLFSQRIEDSRQVLERQDEISLTCAEKGLFGEITWMQEKNERLYLYLQKTRKPDGSSTGGMLIYLDEWEESAYCIGDEIWFQGETALFSQATNPGQFDAAGYYLAQGYSFQITNPRIQVTEHGWSFRQCLYCLREQLLDLLEHISDPEDAGVWGAMLLGDKTGLEEETKELFQNGGISHILAISGLHISFIGMCLYGMLRRMGLSFFSSSVLCSGVMMGYAFLTGSSISALRACMMMLLSLGAGCLGRTYDMPSALALVWMVLSVKYPYQITQAGCQLSFGAVLAISVLLPVARENAGAGAMRGKRRLERIKQWVVEALQGSLTVSLVIWPILAWHYYQISVYSVLLNILVLPLMSVLLAFLLLAVVCAECCLLLTLPLTPARWLLFPAHLVLRLYAFLCERMSLLPDSVLTTGQPRPGQLAGYVVLLCGGFLLLYIQNRRREYKKGEEKEKIKETGELRKNRQAGMSLVFLLLMALIGPRMLTRYRGDVSTVVFVDVGQGDGIFIQSEGVNLFIDGGSSSVSSVGTYRIEPLLLYYGVSHVDAWFLTHPDQDHVNGFLELAEAAGQTGHVRIDNVICPEAGLSGEDWADVLEPLFAADIPVTAIREGDCIQNGQLELSCLYPRETEGYTDTNDLCQVLRLSIGGFSMLLTGDIGAEVENVLLQRYSARPELLQCDLLKVAHHGSAYSSSEDFLSAVDASLAVISCGRNTYGHPAAETLERLFAAGMNVHITQEEGAVILELDTE